MDNIDVRGLPPVLERLLWPWVQAVELSGPGMGDHVTAIAAHGFSALRHRIVLTPQLEQTLVEARMATDVLAKAMDAKRVVPSWTRDAARVAMGQLIISLRGAEPNAVTKELGLGW